MQMLLLYQLNKSHADETTHKACRQEYAKWITRQTGSSFDGMISIGEMAMRQVLFNATEPPSRSVEVNKYETNGKLCGSGKCRMESDNGKYCR